MAGQLGGDHLGVAAVAAEAVRRAGSGAARDHFAQRDQFRRARDRVTATGVAASRSDQVRSDCGRRMEISIGVRPSPRCE